MFQISWPEKIGYVFFLLAFGYAAIKIPYLWFTKQLTIKETIAMVVIAIAFVIPSFVTEYSFLFEIGFLIIGAKNIDFRKLLKTYLVIEVALTLITMVAALTGHVEHLIYESYKGNRYSFGSVYPTDFAAHIVYIVIVFVVLYTKTYMRILQIVLTICMAAFVWYACRGYTSTICLVLVVVAIMIGLLLNQKNLFKVEGVYTVSYIGFAALYLFMNYKYDVQSELWQKIDSALSGRLTITNGISLLNPIKMFGQNIFEDGMGGTIDWPDQYSYIDDSYLRILLKYGIVLFVVFIIMLTYNLHQLKMYNCRVCLMLLSIIALHSFMEQHLLELAYNPFILMTFANLSNIENKTEKKKCIEKKILNGSNI